MEKQEPQEPQHFNTWSTGSCLLGLCAASITERFHRFNLDSRQVKKKPLLFVENSRAFQQWTKSKEPSGKNHLWTDESNTQEQTQLVQNKH